ncbi:MAG: ABC transporter permease [Saprospiraceae bacterium]|nr:ABC transporter permease [Saprospiraceae bacterium]
MFELEIKPQGKFTLGLKELWHYRELFYFFTWRDIKVRYKQAALGIVWAAIQPLSMMLLFTIIFNKGLKVDSDGLPYPIFAFSGLMIWNVFSNGLLNASSSMVANANIIKKIYFPRLIIPLSSILTALFDFLFAFVVFVVLLIYFQIPFLALKLVVLLPLSILLTVITTFGLGTLLASLNVKYRDFQYALPFMIQFLLFLNPVLYSTKAFDNVWAQWIMRLNPLAGAIDLVRSIFTVREDSFGEGVLRWEIILGQFGIAIFILLLGVYVFRKTEAYFADLA